MTRRYKLRGFTLVELAIVITIIGLLIGGVLKGQELLENARVNATVSDLKAYSAAVTTFRDIYKATPGDMSNATNFITGCTAGNNCVNGGGDSVLGTNSTSDWYQIVDMAIATESVQFWKHLALAGLMKGVSGGAASVGMGQSHPSSPLGGGFHARGTAGTNNASVAGIIVLLGSDLTRTNYFDSVSPNVAWRMDDKLDDGIGVSGEFLAISTGSANGCGGAGSYSGDSYDQTSHRKTCDVAYRIAR